MNSKFLPLLILTFSQISVADLTNSNSFEIKKQVLWTPKSLELWIKFTITEHSNLERRCSFWSFLILLILYLEQEFWSLGKKDLQIKRIFYKNFFQKICRKENNRSTPNYRNTTNLFSLSLKGSVKGLISTKIINTKHTFLLLM